MSRARKAPVALVLAAGKGTRMKSSRPKVLFEVLGRSLVRRVIDAAREAGCADVVVVVGHEAEQVRSSLAGLPGLTFTEQRGMQGTGQAVAHARDGADWTDRTVVVLPGDVPRIRPGTIRDLLEAHDGALTVATMHPSDPFGYGRIVRGDDGGVVGIVEQRDATEAQRAIGEVNTGIYAFDGDFLFGAAAGDGAVDALTTDNDQGEYLLTDVVGIAVDRGDRVGASVIGDADEVAGINDRAQLAALERTLRDGLALEWMRAGVTMDDPATVRIEEAVELASDVTLGAGVELRGACRVASGSSIGPGCVLTDVAVGERVEVGPYVVATSATIATGSKLRPFTVIQGFNEKRPHQTTEADRVLIDRDARVGPFTHLRQASDLGPGSHVGNFVELKKTRLNDGAKANHLAYLGDAEVGARSNIGAGVITCNYDGFAKHRTVIGEEAFIGTDSHLVAPVRVGKGAYVATGTTVTKDVPADALAISRTRQQNKAGYGPRLKKQLESQAKKIAERKARNQAKES
jgi:bifunctional UDP-N-acetylglucosamine pyrophosphorylase / glucosamine-1-phosphate N-acetyltransferase